MDTHVQIRVCRQTSKQRLLAKAAYCWSGDLHCTPTAYLLNTLSSWKTYLIARYLQCSFLISIHHFCGRRRAVSRDCMCPDSSFRTKWPRYLASWFTLTLSRTVLKVKVISQSLSSQEDSKYVRLRGRPTSTNGASLAWRFSRRISTVLFTSRWLWPTRWPIRPILGFWGAKFAKMGDSLPWTPMTRRAKFDAVSFVPGGEIHNRTNKQTNTHKQTVNDISTPSLSACVDNKSSVTDGMTTVAE